MLANQRFPSSGIPCRRSPIGVQQIAHEDGIVRESRIGVKVELKIKRGAGVDSGLKISFEFRAFESVDGLLSQLSELRVHLLAQIIARELVIPRAVRKASDGAAIDFLLLSAQAVLLQEFSEAFVKTGIIGIVVDLAAEHGQGNGDLLEFGQARE